MKHPWFSTWGWVYRPISWPGFLVTGLTLAFCLQVFLAVDHRSHSVSDTLYGVFPYLVPAAILWYWIASKSSRKADGR